MEDKGLDFTKPPLEPKYPPVNRSVPRCFLLRETGSKHKTNTVPTELQWAAEDKMVMRSHEEFRCQLPDVSRSTFLMVFSPDGKKVASTHGNHNVYVTDLNSGKNIKTLTGHPRTPWCIAFHPSSNQILASGCLGGQVRVWDLSGGSEIWMAESQTVIASLAFHPIDRMLVIASYNELHFWDWSQPEPFAKCFTANEKEKVRYVAFDALGHKLITGVANAPARLTSQWDRVAAPQPSPQTNQLDSERRITICYRYMVEQYEQLVQRYYDLSRARSTLTMDRGTDPMEFEGESSDSQNTTPSVTQATRPYRPRPLGEQSLMTPVTHYTPQPRPSSGTDEASASHSSTNFLTPPEPSQNDNNCSSATQPLLATSSDSTESGNRTDTPRRNPRFDITLPSFSGFRSGSSSVPNLSSASGDLPVCFGFTNPQLTESSRTRPLSRLSLSPETICFGLTRPDSRNSQNNQSESTQNQPDPPTRPESSSSVQQMVRNLVSSWCSRSNPSDGTSTEVNSGVDSENEDPEPFEGFQSESQSEDEPQPQPSSGIGYTPLPGYNAAGGNPLNSEGSTRRSSEAAAVSQLRSQFHRLQSVYENRNSAYSSHAHVFSPETQAAERRLLNRLNEILDRPLPEPRARRLFASRRSAFQPRPQPSTTTTPSTSTGSVTAASPDIIGGVRYGIQLLSRHIDNMQRLCRARLEILQLQQIRRMWEDLQSQIYALHGAVREGRTEERVERDPPRNEAPAEETPANTADLLTDDDSDGPSSNGELHWRLRRTPQTSRRNVVKTPMPRTPNRNPPTKRTRLMFRPNDSSNRRVPVSNVLLEAHRRYLNRQLSSSTQATSEERGEASSSNVSGETSTGTSDERASVRGLKRKSRDSDPLFRPRPSSNSQGQSSTSSSSTSNLAAVMRETIVQLENMVWRHRQSSSQRNARLSRFTRQREERMMRNLWDTESSHESSRDDQSEGDSSQQSAPGGLDTGDSEWTRDTTRMRARQVLLLMVDSLTQFFENDNLTRRTTNEALNERIHNLYVLLQLALNLTDLLLAQIVHSRRELEARRPSMLEGNNWSPSRHSLRSYRYARRSVARDIGRTSLAWRRILRRAPPATSPSTSPPARSEQPRRTPPTATAGATDSSLTSSRPPPHRHHSVYSNIRSAMLSHYHNHPVSRPVVPIVRVNDLPAPPPEVSPSPRFRPHSPPPMGPHPMFGPPRFLHPARYTGGGFVFDESTSEDSSPQDRSSDFFFMRAGYGSSSVILTDTPMSPHHRIQAWDFSKYRLPDLGNGDKNVVVSECKIHNDASVDMSKDGRLLVTLLPSGRLSMTTLLGIYSLQWDTLGQLLYTTSFEQSIVSVSLSPTTRHLVIGLASRRVALVSADRHANAQVFRLEGASPGRKAPLGARGRLVHLRDLELSRHLGFMSLNCIRWAPNPGQGLVYGTNTGHLRILR